MTDSFPLLMIGAMYENGGNVTHRLLDGHPDLFVYPFESQLGTALVHDKLSSTFPVKYRWPVFSLDSSPIQDYEAIIDEEAKVRTKTPHVSKFRHADLQLSDQSRREIFVRLVEQRGRTRAGNVAAFFEATFEAWTNYRAKGTASVYVGYSPILVVDAETILTEMPGAHFLHVVRNPWSAYADTKKRPLPLSLRDYMLGWTLNQYFALTLKERFPTRLHIVRTEDTLRDPVETLKPVLAGFGLPATDTLRSTTWNGEELEEVYPWGTIRRTTPWANRSTAEELSAEERALVSDFAGPYLDLLDYRGFWQ